MPIIFNQGFATDPAFDTMQRVSKISAVSVPNRRLSLCDTSRGHLRRIRPPLLQHAAAECADHEAGPVRLHAPRDEGGRRPSGVCVRGGGGAPRVQQVQVRILTEARLQRETERCDVTTYSPRPYTLDKYHNVTSPACSMRPGFNDAR